MLPGFTGTSTNFVSAKQIENSDVFTIINLLASDVASLDVNKTVNGIPETDDITRLLNIKPNNLYSGGTLKFIITANALLNGESFVEIIRDGNKVYALNHLKNSQVTVKMDNTTNYKLIYELSENDKRRLLKPENVIHFKFFTIDRIMCISTLMS